MSSKRQDYLFPNLGIVRNIKPTDIFYIFYSREGIRIHIDRKTRTCLVMSTYMDTGMFRYIQVNSGKFRNINVKSGKFR